MAFSVGKSSSSSASTSASATGFLASLASSTAWCLLSSLECSKRLGFGVVHGGGINIFIRIILKHLLATTGVPAPVGNAAVPSDVPAMRGVVHPVSVAPDIAAMVCPVISNATAQPPDVVAVVC